MATPAPSPTSEPAAQATPAASPTPTPELPPVEVVGPLLVLTELLGPAPGRADGEGKNRRVILHDIGLNRHWVAFEYRNPLSAPDGDRSAVQPTGESLIVWSEGQIHRVGLNGTVEALLLDDDAIRDVRVSPDGAKVAVVRGGAGELLVLDAATGEEVRWVYGPATPLSVTSDWRLHLGDWHADGNAVSVSAGGQTAIVALDGPIRVLPDYSEISPDLRYALQFGMGIRGRNRHEVAWTSIDVLDVETGRVLATVSDESGVIPPDEWRDRIATFWLPNSGEPVFHLLSAGPMVLDAQSGELHPLTHQIRSRERSRLDTACYFGDERGTACDARYDGTVIWQGAAGWTEYIGIIEDPRNSELHGISPTPTIRDGEQPPPPARAEMVGPLLVYEVRGEHQDVSDGTSGLLSRSTRRVIVFDEGTGHSWSLFNDVKDVQLARQGVVLWASSFVAPGSPLLYVHPDGRSDRLEDSWSWAHEYRVSPDGRKLAMHLGSSSDGTTSTPAGLVVLDVATGARTMRLSADEIAAAADLDTAVSWVLNLPSVETWTSDSGILVELRDGEDWDPNPAVWHVVVALDGAILAVPCEVEFSGRVRSCFSPDGRYYVARSYDARGGWYGFDVIELSTGEVLHSVDGIRIADDRAREWASPVHFAWPTRSSAPYYFSFEILRRDHGEPVIDISVLDITTGEIEVMDSTEYLARFYPPSRATTDCPAHPAKPCDILLDGEVIGEGRWPRVLGFIELD